MEENIHVTEVSIECEYCGFVEEEIEVTRKECLNGIWMTCPNCGTYMFVPSSNFISN